MGNSSRKDSQAEGGGPLSPTLSTRGSKVNSLVRIDLRGQRVNLLWPEGSLSLRW